MNQCYKTIFSKVHQCFVVVSELTKSQGKGSRASRLKKTAVALLAATAFGGLSGPLAHADTVVITSGSTTINDNHSGNDYWLNGSNITFTVASGGVVNSISGNSDAAVSGNTVTINGGTVNNADTSWIEYPAGSGNWVGKPNLTGGFSTSGAVSDNHVVINKASIGGYFPTVYGGHSGSGSVSKNTVTIESENGIYVYGGHSDTGAVGGDNEADGNIVTVKSGSVHYVAGGWSGANEVGGPVKNNKVIVEDGTVGSQIFGGAGEGGNVELNRVIFEKGSAFEIVGGQSGGKDALNNTVTINDGTVTNVYGGQAIAGWISGNSGNAKGNQVTIGGGKVSGNVYGGYSLNGAASSNTVSIDSSKIGGNVYAG